MNKLIILLLIGAYFLKCKSDEPFRPAHGTVPFIVYFKSRYRGLCVGTVVNRMAIMTAAVCVASIKSDVRDTRPLNVVLGASYRHELRGIRVQVTKILIPNFAKIVSTHRAYLLSKSIAILILKRKIPDILMEIPIRPIEVDLNGTTSLGEDCFMPGWHFFYKGDEIIEPHKYLLQRNLRVQFVNIAKRDLWCGELVNKFNKALESLGFNDDIDHSGYVCVRDTDRSAQPCHGMYGSPLICENKVIGMMMAPDGQWTNCTGFSNIIHLVYNDYLKDFTTCVSKFFEEPKEKISWEALKKRLYGQSDDQKSYDYVADIYDKIVTSSSAESD